MGNFSQSTLGNGVIEEMWCYRDGFKFCKQDIKGKTEFMVMFFKHECNFGLLLLLV